MAGLAHLTGDAGNEGALGGEGLTDGDVKGGDGGLRKSDAELGQPVQELQPQVGPTTRRWRQQKLGLQAAEEGEGEAGPPQCIRVIGYALRGTTLLTTSQTHQML